MAKLTMFNQVSIDGYFKAKNGDMSFAHERAPDAELDAFVDDNAKGGGALLFGRVTYEMMASMWPTAAAKKQMPVLAERMNAIKKYVVSNSLDAATWNNTEILSGDAVKSIRKLKEESREPIAILGSGSLVSALARRKLIDEFQILVVPTILGAGASLFEGVDRQVLTLKSARSFKNGVTFAVYTP